MSSFISPRFDCAYGLIQGRREYQEDCVAADFAVGQESGFAVLSDGMGAHASGDQASSIVVSEFMSYWIQGKPGIVERDGCTASFLADTTHRANDAVRRASLENPERRGMGATVVAVAFVNDQLSWASVGDSALFLHRKGELSRLNEDHSMASSIDAMAAIGEMTPSEAMNHPERGVLTSAVQGREICRIDCPEVPTVLEEGDIVVISSDGLLSLKTPEIQKVVRRNGLRSCADLVQALLLAVEERQLPDQDNVSIIAVRLVQCESGANAASLGLPENERSFAKVPLNGVGGAEIEEAPDILKQALSL